MEGHRKAIEGQWKVNGRSLEGQWKVIGTSVEGQWKAIEGLGHNRARLQRGGRLTAEIARLEQSRGRRRRRRLYDREADRNVGAAGDVGASDAEIAGDHGRSREIVREVEGRSREVERRWKGGSREMHSPWRCAGRRSAKAMEGAELRGGDAGRCGEIWGDAYPLAVRSIIVSCATAECARSRMTEMRLLLDSRMRTARASFIFSSSASDGEEGRGPLGEPARLSEE